MRLLRGKEKPIKLQTRIKAGRPSRTTTNRSMTLWDDTSRKTHTPTNHCYG
jgi:hypothetical protein